MSVSMTKQMPWFKAWMWCNGVRHVFPCRFKVLQAICMSCRACCNPVITMPLSKLLARIQDAYQHCSYIAYAF